MTPRPSDEAREALRAARARAAGETQDQPSPAERQPAGQPHRPGDAAREALRRAVRARRAGPAATDAGVPPAAGSAGEPEREAPGEAPASAARNDPSGPSDRPPAPPAGATRHEAEPEPYGGAPDDDTGTARRPGDVAREALRSARAEAERARTTAEETRHGRTGAERRRGAPRVPRTTRGDRAADERTRQVRTALTDAFRMPTDTNDPRRAPEADAGDVGRVPVADTGDPRRVPVADGDGPRRGLGADAGDVGRVPGADGGDGRRVPGADVDGPRRAPGADAGDVGRVSRADVDDPRRVPPADSGDAGRLPTAERGDARRVSQADADDPRRVPRADAGGVGRVPVADTGDPRRVPVADGDDPRRAQGADAGDPRRVPGADPGDAGRVSRADVDGPRRVSQADAGDAGRLPGADVDGPRRGPSAGTGDARRVTHVGTGGVRRGTPPAAASGVPAGDRGAVAGAVPPSASYSPRAAPRSMAAPGRDGDLRRTFAAFPPRDSEGESFAGTWWGRAWVTALEGGALDPARLARGRGYAEQGHVDAITVTPGLVLAYVRGSRPRPYRVQVRLRTFGDADWERFLDAAVDRPGHIAALLDGEMPQSLADCGVPLLPVPGDLAPRCSCPDSGHPCKHAAALCYQTARLLDADPFVLLLLRGRGEREVIDALSRLSAARAARAAQEKEPEPLPGVRAADAVARRGQLPPLPAPLPPPPHPEQPPVYPASPGGPDPFALDQLATDAAARAHALLTTGRDPVGGLTLWHDAVRLAAARPGSGLTAATRALYSSLARAAGRTPAELARAVAAWRQGGPAGLAVLEEPWDPPAGRFDRARPLLLAADLPAFRPWRNHLTHPRGHVQLRLGRDNLWYAYESEPGHDDWWPRGTPDPDPVGALTGLDAPEAL
ncbi:hypothetical protein GCM10010297_49180 [Streptomyces malachitofuscus]|nr:hypothetical protein GCM10010297_49180 [Streptomyces malachitofuscus]